jgi:hypothetical protein
LALAVRVLAFALVVVAAALTPPPAVGLKRHGEGGISGSTPTPESA